MSSHPGVANGVIKADGSAQITISHNKTGFIWTIAQMSILVTKSDQTYCGAFDVTTLFNAFELLSPTLMVSGAVADGDPSISIGDHDIIYVNISDASLAVGANVVVSYYYDEVNA